MQITVRRHGHLVDLIVSVFLSACIGLKAMFSAASFDEQFALLVACHLYFLFFLIIC